MQSYAKRISLKGALLFTLLLSLTKNCMHNKCMGLYGNLADMSLILWKGDDGALTETLSDWFTKKIY